MIEDLIHEMGYYPRVLILGEYYELSDKGLYTGETFWEKLRFKLNHNQEITIHTGQLHWTMWKAIVDKLRELGTDLKTFEEKYFEDYGRYYEDDQLEEEQYYEDDFDEDEEEWEDY